MRSSALNNLLLAGLLVITASFTMEIKASERAGSISMTIENDMFYHTDYHYTHGLRFSYMPDNESGPPAWALSLAKIIPVFSKDGEIRHAYAFGQSIFTPKDISLDEVDKDGRPYAGFLYCSIGLGVETGQRLDQIIFLIGMVGPASLAAKTQEYIHGLFDWKKPKGWDNQLKNEPGIMLLYQRSWRSLESKTLMGNQLDFTPHFGISAGNLFTYGGAGITMRYGGHLPSDYGPPRIQHGHHSSTSFSPLLDFKWYFFIALEGRFVARNIFLDGNTFHESHSVKKEPLVADLQFGLVIDWAKIRLSYTHIIRSKEFRTQEERDEFGSLAISYKF